MTVATIDDISVLIEQARRGDTAAFGQFVRRYQSLVSGLIFSIIGDFHKSEDLAQETFLIAWNKLGDLRKTDDPAPWLCTIARNLANRSFRKKQEQVLEIMDDQADTTQQDPAREMLRREQSELVWSAIGEIPSQYRETLVLYYRSGQSVREIATATDSSIDAVNQRLVRARQSLKSKLETIIGDILADSAPGEIFTLGVLTMLTGSLIATGTKMTVAATVAGNTGTTVKAAMTATGSGAGEGIGLYAFGALLLNILVPILWTVCVPVSVGNIVKNSPTLRARRFMLREMMVCSTILWMFFAGTLLIPPGPVRHGAFSLGLIAVVGILFRRHSRFYRKLLQEEMLEQPRESEDRFGKISLAPPALWRLFYATSVMIVLGITIAAIQTYRVLVWPEDILAWKILFPIIFIAYLWYFRNMVSALHSSQDRECFAHTAPNLTPKLIERYKKIAVHGFFPLKMKRKRLIFLIILPYVVVCACVGIFFGHSINRFLPTPVIMRILWGTEGARLYPVEMRRLANGLRVSYLYDTKTRDFSLLVLFPGGEATNTEYPFYSILAKKYLQTNPKEPQVLESGHQVSGAYLDNLPFVSERPNDQWHDAIEDIRKLFDGPVYAPDPFDNAGKAVLRDAESLEKFSFGNRVCLWSLALWNRLVSGQIVTPFEFDPDAFERFFKEQLLVEDKIVLCGIGNIPADQFFQRIEERFASIKLNAAKKLPQRKIEPGLHAIRWWIPSRQLLMLFPIPGPEENPDEYAAMLFARYSMSRSSFFYKVKKSDWYKLDALEAGIIQLPEGYFFFLCIKPAPHLTLEDAKDLVENIYIELMQTRGEVEPYEIETKGSDGLFSFIKPSIGFGFQPYSVPYMVEKMQPYQFELEKKYENIRTVRTQEIAYCQAYQDYLYRDENLRKTVIHACNRLTVVKIAETAKKYFNKENAFVLYIEPD